MNVIYSIALLRYKTLGLREKKLWRLLFGHLLEGVQRILIKITIQFIHDGQYIGICDHNEIKRKLASVLDHIHVDIGRHWSSHDQQQVSKIKQITR